MVMKAAPSRAPRIEPTPPITTMNSNSNERSIEKASGSHEPRCTKAHSAPATPITNELNAKAESLACSGRMPMISAAMSMSRIAIHIRPTRPRTRFLAASAIRHSSDRQNT